MATNGLEWSGKGVVITDWRGHNNKDYPRNLTAPRYPLPPYPGQDCTDEEWALYNRRWEEWEDLVWKRWQRLSKTRRYRNKKV